MSQLFEWLHDLTRPISIGVITGRAGSGKTRLALEFIHRIESRETGGWLVGFLGGRQLEHFKTQAVRIGWGWNQPVLAIIDYAGSLVREIQPLLDSLVEAEAQPEMKPFRLLLLEREAQFDSGWLSELRGSGYSEARRASLFHPRAPFELEPLIGGTVRREILRATLEATASLLNVPSIVLPELGENPPLDAQLASSQLAEPLPLLMAALVATRGQEALVSALHLGRLDLAFRVSNHERKRIRSFAPASSGVAANLLERLTALVTIAGGLSTAGAYSVAEKAVEGYVVEGGPQFLVDTLFEISGGDDATVAPITPDLVAEAFALVALKDVSFERQEALLLRTAESTTHPPTAFLLRLAQDFSGGDWTGVDYTPEMISGLRQMPLRWLAALVDRGGQLNIPLLMRLVNEMPMETSVLARQALEITSRLVHALDSGMVVGPANQMQTLRTSIGMFMVYRLEAVGDIEGAADAAEMVLPLLETEAPTTTRNEIIIHCLQPCQCISYFARAGRTSIGDRAMRRILGKLSVVSRNISDYDSDVLGAAFSNLAYYCNVLKRPMRAVVLSTRSVNLYRAAEKVSDDFAYHEYAQALFAHSAALYRAKKWNEAHETIDEAVSIFRRLAAVNPDAYQLKLLDVLALCAEVESARSEYEGAAQAVREGLAIVDKLNSETEAYSARAHAGLHTIRALLLERDGNAPGVIEAAGAALEAILPAFKAWPTLNDDLTMRLCANYISRCRRSGVAPDSRIVTKLFVIREEVSQN